MFLAAAVLPPATAQPFHLDAPADSPLWWTLTEDLSAAELQAALTDQQGHIDRYRAALAAGRVARPVDPSQLPGIYYVDAHRTPELVPLWYALDWLTIQLSLAPPEELRDRLRAGGLSAEGAEAVVEACQQIVVQQPVIGERIRDDLQEFLAIQRAALGEDGGTVQQRRVVKEALDSRDFTFFTQFSQRNESEIARLYAAWRTNPAEEVANEVLPSLKGRLSRADWNTLRRFLLVEVVPETGEYLDVDYFVGRSR